MKKKVIILLLGTLLGLLLYFLLKPIDHDYIFPSEYKIDVSKDKYWGIFTVNILTFNKRIDVKDLSGYPMKCSYCDDSDSIVKWTQWSKIKEQEKKTLINDLIQIRDNLYAPKDYKRQFSEEVRSFLNYIKIDKHVYMSGFGHISHTDFMIYHTYYILFLDKNMVYRIEVNNG